MHCVDDPENCEPDIVLPILFPEEKEVQNVISNNNFNLYIQVGFNIRPYLYECLEEANKYF